MRVRPLVGAFFCDSLWVPSRAMRLHALGLVWPQHLGPIGVEMPLTFARAFLAVGAPIGTPMLTDHCVTWPLDVRLTERNLFADRIVELPVVVSTELPIVVSTEMAAPVSTEMAASVPTAQPAQPAGAPQLPLPEVH